jgi:hypothetical protein
MRIRWHAGRLGAAAAVPTLVLGLLALLAAPRPAEAQKAGATAYLREASASMDGLLARSQRQGYRLNRGGFSIAGGWMQQGKQNWVEMYNIDLRAGVQYRFLASGDADARDVDLRILGPGGNIVAKDASTAREAVVDFTPRQTARYHIQVRLFASRNNLPCICLTALLSR